jgi:ubiquinone/menaquinone biosynthesis C-methylase UbiE
MHQQINHSSFSDLPFPKRLLVILLRFFFKLLYHQFAWTYDWVASIVSLGAWKSWVLSAPSYLDSRRTLEIGFGPGHLQLALHQMGITAIGLDESSQMAKTARRRLLRQGLSPNLIRGEAESLPFVDECFHQVVMTFPAEFIFKQKTLSDIHRVLIKGGKAIVIPLAWLTGRNPLDRLFAWVNRITGEAPEWDEKSLEPIKKLGFIVSWELVILPTSKLLIIKLIKPVTN